ncbi:MAG: glycosyltransferase family 9 protein [Sphingobacteriales bacterium]|nr:glycosyltransferase family 9 protein [Sphingobacteriales bacterium]
MKAEKLIYFLSMILSKIINFNKRIERIEVQKILIFKLDAVGDMVYTTPVFRLLKQKYPAAEITLFCQESIKPLVQFDPHLHQIIADFSLLQKHYDLILDLRGNFKTLKYALLHPPKIRLDRGSVRFRNKLKGKHPHELITNSQIIASLLEIESRDLVPRIYFSDEDEKQASDFLKENSINRFAILHVGANKALRKWPLDRFAALANFLKNEYQHEIIFVGDDSDVDNIEVVQTQIGFKTFSVAGHFGWTAFAALAKKAQLFVGNESGPLHVAAAMDIPLVGLFGPGEPKVFYPCGEKSTFVHHVLPCNPCNQLNCVNPENTCMQRISLNEVINKILSLKIKP